MAGVTRYKLTLADDRNAVSLEIIKNDSALALMVFTDADQLDGFISDARGMRGQMVDQVPESLDPMPRLGTRDFPNWWVFDPTETGRILALRHPQFGWLGFSLSQQAATDITVRLVKPHP